MSGYQRGAKRERDVLARLRDLGYWASRAAGSHGEADVVALKGGEALLVQIKSDRRSAFANFGPDARRELLGAAERAGAKALLIHWPPDRKGPRWYWGPTEWPAGS